MADVIETLKGLVGRATKGPWKAGRTDIRSYLGDGTPVHYVYRGDDETAASRIRIVPMTGSAIDPTDDALLIVAAVNAIPALLAVAEAAKKYTASGGECDREDLRNALANLETHNG